MKFFRISAFSRYEGKYATSSGWNSFANMQFLRNLSENDRASLVKFLEMNPGEPGMNISAGGSRWPDCIAIGGSEPRECYSERVITDLESAGIAIWRKTKMPIAKIEAKRLLKIPPPQYYVLEGERGIDVDYSVFGLPLNERGFPIRGTYNPSKMGPPPLRLDSWNGQHLMSARTLSPMNLYCTDVVKSLCEEKGWTNFKFKEVPVIS